MSTKINNILTEITDTNLPLFKVRLCEFLDNVKSQKA